MQAIGCIGGVDCGILDRIRFYNCLQSIEVPFDRWVKELVVVVDYEVV